MNPSTLPPQKLREIVFQLLYSAGFGSDESVDEMVMQALSVTKRSVRLAQEIALKIQEKLAEIDALIIKHSESYDWDRIPRVEKTILRLGIYELLMKEVPGKVAIAEAIRLSRKFATKESAHFINAILDTLYKLQPESVQEELLQKS